MSNPAVSVIIPSHNAGAFLGETVDSVLSQTLPALECIVVDDGSTDGSVQAIRGRHPLVRVIHQPNLGRAQAAASAAAMAQGDVLALLDADDVWMPRKLEASIDALADDSYGMVHTRIELLAPQGAKPAPARAEQASGWAARCLLQGNPICCSSVVVWRQIWNELGGLEGQYWPADDYHLWLRLAARHRLAFVDEPLVGYRVHDRQASRGRVAMIQAQHRVVRDFLACHRGVRDTLNESDMKWILKDRFIELAAHYGESGFQEAARALFRWLVCRHPTSPKVWRQLLKSHLPWPCYRWLIRSMRRATAATLRPPDALSPQPECPAHR